MSPETSSSSAKQVPILLEIVPENLQEPDIALVDSVRDGTIRELEREGHSIESSETGQKGGFPTELVTFIIANRDAIELTASLLDIAVIITTVGHTFYKKYQKLVGKDIAEQRPPTLTVEYGGARITLEHGMFNMETAEATAYLAKELGSHPGLAGNPPPQGKPKVTGSVPKRHRQRK